MIRLIGILTGCAFGIALLILAFGLPESAPKHDVFPVEAVVSPDEPPLAETPLNAPAEAEPAEAAPVEAAPVEAAPVEAPLQSIPVSTSPETLAETPPEEAPVIEEPVASPAEDPPPAAQPEQHWYAFWSPFRSRIAADGFVAELQRTTGLDYRVVKLKPGIYEVAFAYTDDADIRDKLDRISAATGMDMSGG